MVRKTSEQYISRLLSVSLLFFVLAGVICLAVGAKAYFHDAGISTAPRATRAKLTPAPDVRIVRPTPQDAVPGPPTVFTAPDGTERIGQPLASSAKDPAFSEPGKSNGAPKSNIGLAVGGAFQEPGGEKSDRPAVEFSRKSVKGM